MTQNEYGILMRCHDFIMAFKLFRDACARVTDDDIAFMEQAFDVAARHGEQTKED